MIILMITIRAYKHNSNSKSNIDIDNNTNAKTIMLVYDIHGNTNAVHEGGKSPKWQVWY